MAEPRRVRTQAERAAADHAWQRDLIGVRTSDGRLYAPEDVQLVYPDYARIGDVLREHLPAIGEALTNLPPRRRWWHSYRREITRIRAESRRLLVRMQYMGGRPGHPAHRPDLTGEEEAMGYTPPKPLPPPPPTPPNPPRPC